MQTPFPCLWHLKSSLDAQSLHCDAISSEKSSQFFCIRYTDYLHFHKCWRHLSYTRRDGHQSNCYTVPQMCVNHQHNLRHHCRLRIWEYTWQTGKLVGGAGWRIDTRLLVRSTDNLHSYKCQRHFFYTRRGGRQRNCYTVWQNCASDQDNDDNRCTCRIWGCTLTHRGKQIGRGSMIER